MEQCHNILWNITHRDNANHAETPVKNIEYSAETAKVMARYIVEIHEGATNHGASFAQNYIMQKGLKKFVQAGADADSKELDQLHSRN